MRPFRCKVIYILNLAQMVALIRRVNPHSRIVLHIERDWLAGLDREVVDGELSVADAIVGCCHHIANSIRRRFPPLATKGRTIYHGVGVSEFAPLFGMCWALMRSCVFQVCLLSLIRGHPIARDAPLQRLCKSI